eukprot:m.1638969 g.1638969  ORF g.1638969 m.1638969 type:complete len:452 (-) comp32254_c0_seq1:63-1418(-)
MSSTTSSVVAGGICFIAILLLIKEFSLVEDATAPAPDADTGTMSTTMQSNGEVFPDIKTVSDFKITQCIGFHRIERNLKKILPFWRDVAPWAAVWAHKHQRSCQSGAGVMQRRAGIIYRCKKYCGGLGDRFRGMAVALWLAFALDVPLEVHWDHVELSDWLEPNIFDWVPRKTSSMDEPMLVTDIARKNFSAIPGLREHLHKTLNGAASTVLTLNTIEILKVFANDRGDLALSQLRFRRVMSSVVRDENFESKMMQFAYHFLFRPTTQFSDRISLYRKYSLEQCCGTKEESLHYIGMHLRFGGSPQDSAQQVGFSDSYLLIDPARTDDILTCIDNLTTLKKECILLVSDNAAAKSILVMSGHSRLCALNTSVSHVDRSHNKDASRYGSGVADMFLEWGLLSMADGYISVVPSGFSQTAYALPQWSSQAGATKIEQIGSCCSANISLQRKCV